jgi:hypothetical protein
MLAPNGKHDFQKVNFRKFETVTFESVTIFKKLRQFTFESINFGKCENVNFVHF